jgi:hypothetical protein
MDPNQIRLNQVLFQERLEAAAQNRQAPAQSDGFSLVACLRSVLSAGVRTAAVPPAPRKAHS